MPLRRFCSSPIQTFHMLHQRVLSPKNVSSRHGSVRIFHIGNPLLALRHAHTPSKRKPGMAVADDELTAPSRPYRALSAATFLLVGTISKLFLTLACRTETHGVDKFLKLLEEREDVGGRENGLLTVSNHVSVLDDPLIWGILPYRFLSNPETMRWSLGSYDICFKHGSYQMLSKFFFLGQTLPTHRLAYSKYGGLFQPTISQCIRLLSNGPFLTPTPFQPLASGTERTTPEIPLHHIEDPFTDSTFTYTTNGTDHFQAPAAYGNRRCSWVHIFPEGMIHQHSGRAVRYFKWGVARMILESEPCPTVVPMWIEGPDQVMHESRGFPRFLPRVGKSINITFGDAVSETVWEGFRERWRQLKKQQAKDSAHSGTLDETMNEELMHGSEAKELRLQVVLRVREEIMKLRRNRGWPDEDPKAKYHDAWLREGPKREGRMDDGSWIKDT